MANDNTESILANLRSSPNATERGSIYYGRVVSDGSPMLVPREAIQEHVHIAGPSGGGKTALYLAPTLEQLVWNGDCSAIMLDLKADSLELLATLQQAAQTVRSEKGTELALKVFSSQSDRPTLAFNPLTQRFWKKLDLYTKTDLLCAACGLAYGTEYAHAYYSTANSAVLYYSMQKFGEATNFAELAEAIGQVISSSPKKRDLHPEILKAGNHVHEVMKRLAACPGLNASAHTSHPTEVLDHAIDMEDVFLKPQLLYFHLPSTVSPTAAPEIARLATYMLLAAATKTKRNHPVFLVIDEFQRMVAGNLEFLLQLARSMGVGVILANQSLQDLRKPTLDLIPVIETNCRVRQWLGVLSPEDQDRLIKISGETVDYSSTWSTSVNAQGGMSYSKSVAEQVVPRLSVNDVRAVSDHPLRSFFLITRGAGYAQYSGLPVIIESKFHISKEEYERRKSIDWPRLAGSFDPCDYPDEAITQPLLPTPSRSAGPQWSEEVIGEQPERVVPLSEELRESLNSLFGQENEPLPRPPRRSRRKPS